MQGQDELKRRTGPLHCQKLTVVPRAPPRSNGRSRVPCHAAGCDAVATHRNLSALISARSPNPELRGQLEGASTAPNHGFTTAANGTVNRRTVPWARVGA